MKLWATVIEILGALRPAFGRARTFLWFSVVVLGFCTRSDLAGVSSFIRALALHERYYERLLGLFHSSAVHLEKLTRFWTKLVLTTLPVCSVKGRLVLVADGIKIPKEGRKMPAVKLLHQNSQSNSKAEYIMGHSLQAISALVEAGAHTVSVPLTARIHEGIVLSNRWTKTILDKLLALLAFLELDPCYLVADAYYATGKMVRGALAQGHHLITCAHNNAVAYEPPAPARSKARGRKKKYGKKVELKRILATAELFDVIPSTIYDDINVMLRVRCLDLIWKPAGQLMRFVFVIHPTRANIMLMSSDLTLSPAEIVRLYALRFKIELGFKHACRTIGVYSYHFWSRAMRRIRRRSGDQYLHRSPKKVRTQILHKLRAYHLFIQTGIIAHGILVWLSVTESTLVWRSFGSWLRTIRPGIPPSEQVVMLALSNTLMHFLAAAHKPCDLQKFIRRRLDPQRSRLFRLAA